MSKQLILILGGARSGKSSLAERLASQYQSVLFVATAEALDEDMERRIAQHKSAVHPNGAHWKSPLTCLRPSRTRTTCAMSVWLTV